MARDSNTTRLEEVERALALERELLERHCEAVAALQKRCDRAGLAEFEKRMEQRRRIWSDALGFMERTLDRFAATTGRLFAEGIVEGTADVERATRSLAKAIIADLVASVMRLTFHQSVQIARQKLIVAQNAVEAASVWNLVAAYRALAAARLAAFAPFGFVLPFHAGGAVMHSGGRAERAHAGLMADEAPYILQRGEYVVRRAAAKSVGYDVMDYINRTGRLPSPPQPVQVNISLSVSALDSDGIERLTTERIIPMIRRATERGIKAVHKRGIWG